MARELKEGTKAASGASAQEGAGFGWGLSAEDQEERFFLRRLAFSITVAVVVVMGVWLVLTTPSRPVQSGSLLSAEAPGDGSVAYTVLLRTVPGSQMQVARQLMATDAMQELAGSNRWRCVQLQGGSVALCVGRFARKDSPQLVELLQRYRQVSTSSGARPFASAQIVACRQ